jgi:hypothetical protein
MSVTVVHNVAQAENHLDRCADVPEVFTNIYRLCARPKNANLRVIHEEIHALSNVIR